MGNVCCNKEQYKNVILKLNQTAELELYDVYDKNGQIVSFNKFIGYFVLNKMYSNVEYEATFVFENKPVKRYIQLVQLPDVKIDINDSIKLEVVEDRKCVLLCRPACKLEHKLDETSPEYSESTRKRKELADQHRQQLELYYTKAHEEMINAMRYNREGSIFSSINSLSSRI